MYGIYSYWTVTRADGTSQRADLKTLDEIQNGDVYELIAGWYDSSDREQEVYVQCDVDEL